MPRNINTNISNVEIEIESTDGACGEGPPKAQQELRGTARLAGAGAGEAAVPVPAAVGIGPASEGAVAGKADAAPAWEGAAGGVSRESAQPAGQGEDGGGHGDGDDDGKRGYDEGISTPPSQKSAPGRTIECESRGCLYSPLSYSSGVAHSWSFMYVVVQR